MTYNINEILLNQMEVEKRLRIDFIGYLYHNYGILSSDILGSSGSCPAPYRVLIGNMLRDFERESKL